MKHLPLRRVSIPMIALLVLFIAFVARTIDLSAQSIWYDEGYTVMFAQRNIGQIVSGAAQLELNTPLHYLLLKGWMAFAGTSEFSTRLLSVFASVVTVALAFAITKFALGCATIVPMLLVALSPVCILTGREVRMYALAACLCAASTALFIACLRRNRASRWVAWSLVSLAAFATHVLAAFFIGAQMLVLIIGWIRRRPHRTAVWASASVLVLIALGGARILTSGGSYGTTFRGQLNPLTTMGASFAAQLLPRLLPEPLALPAAVVAVALVVLTGGALRTGSATRAVWFVGSAAIVLIALLSVATGKFSSRYPALAAPLFLIGVGMAFAPAFAPRPDVRLSWLKPLFQNGRLAYALQGSILFLFTLGVAFGLWQLRSNRVYANDDFRGAAAFVRANARPDEAVLLVSGHFAPAFAYYFGDVGWTALPNDDVLNVNHTLTWESAMPLVNAALAGRGGAWLVLWQDDLIDPTGLVAALMRRQSQAFAPVLDTVKFNGLRLRHYRFIQPYRPLPVTLPPSTSRIESVGQAVGLSSLGCDQPQLTYVGDGWLEVHCFWQVKPFVQLSGFTKASLRLFDSSGKQVLQSDQPIAPNGMPYYPFEKPILGLYFIELPQDIAPGAYTLRVIPYAEQGEFLPQVVTPIRIIPKSIPSSIARVALGPNQAEYGQD